MYRFLFRPIWLLFHVVVVAGIVTMILLGFWQLDRLDERQEFNRSVIERSEQPPVPLTELLGQVESGTDDIGELEWRRVTASGTFLPDQILEFNNSQGGRAGDNVLTPLLLDDLDLTVIVNRGFIPLGFDTPSSPQVGVDITGFVRPSEVRDRGSLTDAQEEGEALTEIRRIDVPLLAEQIEGEVAPVYVQLTDSSSGVGAGDPEPVILPELNSGPHLSYAMQWFIFALAVAVGWFLAVRRSIGQHRRDAAVKSTARVESELS